MAPITDEKFNDLKDQYHQLEERIKRLEHSLKTGESKPSVAESMRMILIGPPGAGKSLLSMHSIHYALTDPRIIGKGTQAPKIKDKYCVCHLVCPCWFLSAAKPN